MEASLTIPISESGGSNECEEVDEPGVVFGADQDQSHQR